MKKNAPVVSNRSTYEKKSQQLPPPSSTPPSSSANKVKIPLKRTGSLAMFGYALKEADSSKRQDALRGAVAMWGSSYVIKKLTVLGIYNKNRNPAYARRAAGDVSWVQLLRDGMAKTDRNANLKTTRTRRYAVGA